MVTHNALIPAPGRNCMTHSKTLTATAAKIIHTTVQLYPTSCEVLVIVVCVDIVRQRVFPYESYVKCSSARKCRRKFRHKFPGITVLSTTGIHDLINNVRSTGLLLDKKPAKKTPCYYRRNRRNRG
jgi:hypothetical protein